MILVSACLVGCRCRYDQGAKPHDPVIALIREGKAVPVCPEQMGGLPTPRLPAEIIGGDGDDVLDGRARVVNVAGEDVTDAVPGRGPGGPADGRGRGGHRGDPEGAQPLLRQRGDLRRHLPAAPCARAGGHRRPAPPARHRRSSRRRTGRRAQEKVGR